MNEVNYEAYKYFYQVAINKSISKAALALNVSQPAVTWQIKSLEEVIGITLFTRTKRGVTLTEEGKVLFNYVDKGIEAFTNGQNALTNLRNLNYGSIKIGASTTVSKHVLMPYLEMFHDKYPNIDIQIVNNLTENLLDDLRSGRLDILFLNLPIENTNDLKIQNILEVQDIFVCGKKYKNITNQNLELGDLSKYPLLFQKQPSSTRNFLDSYLLKNNIDLKPKTEIVSYNLIMDFVKSGFGIGYATREFIQDELNNKELFEINVSQKVPKRNIGMVTLSKTIPNYSTQKLVSLICKR